MSPGTFAAYFLRNFVKPERKSDRLWGGRFENAPDARFDAFQRSFRFDRRLLPYEIAVDRAWAKALQGVDIFTETEVRQTLAALDKIAERARTDNAWIDSSTAEDVHQFIENAIVEELGPLGWNSTPAAAATNWWPPISVFLSSTPPPASVKRCWLSLMRSCSKQE